MFQIRRAEPRVRLEHSPTFSERTTMHQPHQAPMFALGAAVIAALVGFTPVLAGAQMSTVPGKNFAQTLVKSAQTGHPSADEIGISAKTDKGCVGIASTDKTDIGQTCEADDIVPLRTGKPSVERDGSGFDVSVLLRDAADKTVGVLGVGFKAAPGMTRAKAIAETESMEKEMAARIPSKTKLLAPSA